MDGELRKDAATGKWVLVRHPADRRRGGGEAAPPPCPFCPGNERLTPPEIVAYRGPESRPDQPGWRVRVFPEVDPYFAIEEDLVREGVGMHDRISLRGASEILVEDPDHGVTLASIEEEQLARVLWMYRDRIQDLKRDTKIRSVVVTRRHGNAGAKIRHPYSRVLAAPIIFDDLRTELVHAREYYGYKRRCVYCDTIREEITVGARLVRVTLHFIAFVPYAARSPFELRVMPRRHSCVYEEISAAEVADLSRLGRELLGLVAKTLGDPPYELVLHSAPNEAVKIVRNEWDTIGRDYHWHLEITPHPDRRVAIGGIAVNQSFPEEAARLLREEGASANEPVELD